MTSIQSSTTTPALSSRGKGNAAMIDDKMQRMLNVFRNLYDPETNPQGIVSFGVADNGLMRPELLSYFNHNRLNLFPGELTYGDRIFTSSRLLEALSNLFNNVPDGLGSEIPQNIEKVRPEHIIIGTGASGILDGLFWSTCDAGEGVLLSTPYYNGFDGDTGIRSAARIVPVNVPEPKAGGSQDHLAKETLKYYEDAIEKAKNDGIKCKVLLICNPHNPTGGIYPRSTIIEFCKFASKHSLHLIMDEIYARSIFTTSDPPRPEKFHSILTIDVKKEANLDPSSVSVVTSASKDFSVNGFRLGVAVIQHNEQLRRAMTSLGILAQSSSPAGALWYTWLNDSKFLSWYLKENRRRLALSYRYVTDWFKHFGIPYVPSTSGHFFLCDLSEFLDPNLEKKEAEGKLLEKLLDEKVFLAPGAQYHHPTPGWYRFTFTTSAKAIQEGLSRVERTLGLKPFSKERELLDFKGGEKCPYESDFDKLDSKPLSSKGEDQDSLKESLETAEIQITTDAAYQLEKGRDPYVSKNPPGKSLLNRLSCGLL